MKLFNEFVMGNKAVNFVRESRRAGGFAQAVLLYLADCMNDVTGKCNPSRDTIAEFFSSEDSPCTIKRVERALARLRELGFIVSTRVPYSRQTESGVEGGWSNSYTLVGFKTGVTPETCVTPILSRGHPQNGQGVTPILSRGHPQNGGINHKEPEENHKEPEDRAHSNVSLTLTPAEKPKRKRRTTPAKPQELTDQTWKDWNAQRNAKHAPISETVVKKFRAEAEKAGISLEEAVQYSIFRGWQGFQADWYLKNLAKEKAISTNRPLQREDMVYTDDF